MDEAAWQAGFPMLLNDYLEDGQNGTPADQLGNCYPRNSRCSPCDPRRPGRQHQRRFCCRSRYLGVLNVLLKPILVFLSFPITILTLGLFLFVINALVFWLAGSVMSNFEVKSFGSALFGSLTVSIVSALASMVVI